MRGRTISSLFTWLHKFLLPFVLAIGLPIFISPLFFSDDINWTILIILIIFFLIVLLYVYFVTVPLKKVALEDGYLVISNYFKTIEVSCYEIKSVFELPFPSSKPKGELEEYLYNLYGVLLIGSANFRFRIFITFENPTEFGKWIMFKPQIPRRFSSYTGDHEIVKELKDLAGIVTQDS
jgi:hypothetical protein